MSDRKRPVTPGWAITLLCSPLALAGSGAGGAALAQVGDAKASPTGTPTAEMVLRRTADFYKKVKSLAVDVERVQTMGPITMKTTVAIAVQRPNRFAIRTKGGGPVGIDVVSDGKTMYVSIPQLQKYTEGEAPDSVEGLGNDPIVQGILQVLMIGELCADDPYAKLMEGVKTASYAGQEPLVGVPSHHLKFTQDQFDWEMWIAAGGEPLIRRIVVDLTKSLANSPLAQQFKNQKLDLTQDFKDWRIDRGVDEKSFAFEPPKGAQKVTSFMEALGGAQAPSSPLVGKLAPDVNLKLLDQGDFRLKDHRDAHVVMLDFWATWCGPCVQELPLLAEVAAAYKDKGVVFCAVNEQEKPDQIHKFLKEKKLAITVALDSEGAVGAVYHAEAIPLLVLIDKKGVVQSVHVGYNPAIKTTLCKELDALLAGKNLAKEALRDAKAAQKTEGLELSWSVSGPYSSVATDPQGHTVYAVQAQGRCDVLDSGGKTTRTFRLPGSGQPIVRFARLARDSENLLAFGPWGASVLASKVDGSKLWEETGGQGIDDVWAADLDGDGVDEVIVGYNGSTGLHVFSADGKRLWKRTDMGNVWHVTAADLDHDGKPEVVTTSAQGKVHVFSPGDGKPLRTLDAGLYANMVRTAPGRAIPSARGDLVLVIGSASPGEAMVALGGDGKIHWTMKLPADVRHCDSLAVSPDGALAAAGLRGGQICVVDLGHGRIVAQVAGQGLTPMVAWAARADAAAPLLLVANGRELNAFRVKPGAAPAENRRP
jgi:thiol-disulfide isomerase/thioredoxin